LILHKKKTETVEFELEKSSQNFFSTNITFEVKLKLIARMKGIEMSGGDELFKKN
jgi:hypothetical protein